MRRTFLLLLTPLFSGLTACTLNSVHALPAGDGADDERAVLVYGVAVEGHWDHERFGVQLDEYDLAKRAITGNCLRYNRTEASVSAKSGSTQYFAFRVPAGAYAYSRFNGAAFDGDSQAFLAPAGRTVYVGTFIYTKASDVALRRDLAAFAKARSAALPKLEGEVALAQTASAAPPRPFLCAP